MQRKVTTGTNREIFQSVRLNDQQDVFDNQEERERKVTKNWAPSVGDVITAPG